MAASQRHEHIVKHAHRAEQLRGLVSARDAGARDAPGRRASELGVRKADAAGVRTIEPADHVQHGRLARTVRSDDAGDPGRLCPEADAGCGPHAAECDSDARHRQRTRCGAGREKFGQRSLNRPRVRLIRAAQIARQGADDSLGGEPQHDEQQDTDHQQTVFREMREHFGHQHRDNRSDDGTDHPSRTAHDDGKQKQDRLRERK